MHAAEKPSVSPRQAAGRNHNLMRTAKLIGARKSPMGPRGECAVTNLPSQRCSSAGGTGTSRNPGTRQVEMRLTAMFFGWWHWHMVSHTELQYSSAKTHSDVLRLVALAHPFHGNTSLPGGIPHSNVLRLVALAQELKRLRRCLGILTAMFFSWWHWHRRSGIVLCCLIILTAMFFGWWHWHG